MFQWQMSFVSVSTKLCNASYLKNDFISISGGWEAEKIEDTWANDAPITTQA